MCLSVSRQLREHVLATRIIDLLVPQKVFEPHATMSTHLAVRQVTGLEQRDEMRARDVQEVGGLLRGKLSLHRHDRDGVAIGHLPEKLQQQFGGLAAYDVVFVGCDNGEGECMLLLQHLRAFDRATEVVVVCGQRTAREMHAEKSRLNVMSFVQTPIVELEFFRLIARLRSRQTAPEPARGGTQARRSAPPARV